MAIRRLLVLLSLLSAACGPVPDEAFLEEDVLTEGGGAEDLSSQELAGWRPCNNAPLLLADIRPGTAGSRPRELVHGDGVLFFTAEDGVHGRELWKSSGIGGAGTSLVKDLRQGSASSNPRRLTVAWGKLFFTAEDGVHGRELWVSDGTAEGTVMAKDIWPGSIGSAPDQLLAIGDVVYFAANDGVNGNELWVSDGTPEGTFLLEDLYPGDDISTPGLPGSSSPRRLTRVGDTFYFVANLGDGVHVWRSKGLPGATSVFSGPEDTFLLSLTAVGSSLFFLVDNGEGEASLWRTWGGPAQHLRFFPGLYPHELTAVGRRLFFSAGAGEDGLPGDPRGEELWVSRGTAWGTALVRDLRPGTASSAPGSFAALGGRLYFAAEDGARGRELWRSDGTARGTTLLRELVYGAAGSSPQELVAISGRLFFSADTPGRGREAWMSDGTASGTVPLGEIAPGAASSNPRGFIRSGWSVFFTATSPTHGEELWALRFRPRGRCTHQGPHR
ncbi:MAG: quinoprotein [Myxococcaceae bacterium]|nr:quinoprotein [Myxococcaceae bacterium]